MNQVVLIRLFCSNSQTGFELVKAMKQYLQQTLSHSEDLLQCWADELKKIQIW